MSSSSYAYDGAVYGRAGPVFAHFTRPSRFPLTALRSLFGEVMTTDVHADMTLHELKEAVFARQDEIHEFDSLRLLEYTTTSRMRTRRRRPSPTTSPALS